MARNLVNKEGQEISVVDISTIQKDLAELQNQRQQAIARINAIDGAIELCNAYLTPDPEIKEEPILEPKKEVVSDSLQARLILTEDAVDFKMKAEDGRKPKKT